MKVTFVWKSPVLADRSIADVMRELTKRLDGLSLYWEFDPKSQSESQRVLVRIESPSHRDSLRAIYRLSAAIHAGSIQLINDRVEMLY